MRLRPRLDQKPDEGGFTIVEMIIALAVVAVVFVGFTASIALGFRTIAVARQRTTASEIAAARLEEARNIPFSLVALTHSVDPGEPALDHSSDPEHPNYFLSNDSPVTQYDVTGSGDYETLVFDDTSGFQYVEDPITVGSTVMEVYQYVTWVDEPDVKRVTVVVRYKAPAINGVNKLLRLSTVVTEGTVTYTPPTSSTPTTGGPGTTTTTVPGPTTTTTLPGVCFGDTVPPTGSFTVGATGDAEVGFTAAPNVTLNFSFTDTCTPIVANFSNDGATYGGDVVYDSANPSASWSLPSGDGTKTVYGRVRDGVGNTLDLGTQSVVLDTTDPTVPGTLLRTLSCSGSDRNVTLSWVASSDTNLRGYRVYRSTDNTTWSVLTTTSSTSATDSHKKDLDSVRYQVTAYDKAGNESAATNTVTLTKNQCS